jgi:acyl-CoA thioesterase I
MRGKVVLCAVLLLLGFATPAGADTPTILVVGDSLSGAYGIPTREGWVALLQERLRREGYPHRVVNHSRPGRDLAQALRELPASLWDVQPDLVIVELGAVDGIRGAPLPEVRDYLAEVVSIARSEGASVALLEMRLPPGRDAYGHRFSRVYAEVARAHGVTLVPFFMRSFATRPGSFQEDHVHPTAAVQPRMLEEVWPAVARLLPERAAADGAAP